MERFLTIAGGVTALVGAAAAIALAARWLLQLGRRVTQFLEDWNGEPPRRGVPGRAGVMERLEIIEGQLKPNGGTSLHDKVDRIERATGSATDPPSPPGPPS